jgi:uncharacterized membrane protein YcaP (DUF421 family)
MWSELGVTWPNAILVVISTACMYLAFIALVRTVGQRSLAAMATFDLVLVVAVGSVVARASLLRDPSLLAGIIAITTLFVMQGLLGTLRENHRVDLLLHRPPLLLVAEQQILHANLARAHIVESELRQRLRLAGVGSMAEVRVAILERNGAISVIRSGTPVAANMLDDVVGHEAFISDHPKREST